MVSIIENTLSIFGQDVTLVKPTTTEYGSGSTKRVYGISGDTVEIAVQKLKRSIVQEVEGQEHTIDTYAMFDTDLDVDERDMFILSSGEKFIVLNKLVKNDNMKSNEGRYVKTLLQIYSE